MSRARRITVIVLVIVVLCVLGPIAALYLIYPMVPSAEKLDVPRDNESIEHGAYLTNHVAVCIDCHSKRDWNRFSGPLVHGTTGQGGERFGREFGFPGEFFAANITPTGIEDYEDGELARLITSGVTRDGRVIFPLMPYPAYARLCEKDLQSMVAYLRTLAPIVNEVPPSTIDFPVNLLIRTVPTAYQNPPCPDRADPIARGEYLAYIAGCHECHTPIDDRGNKLLGRDFAGGFRFPMNDGVAVSPNLTSDPTTGIGDWTEARFLGKFRAFIEGTPEREPGAANTPMPWTMYSGMNAEDLKAIFAYLKSLPPISNAVQNWTPTTPSP